MASAISPASTSPRAESVSSPRVRPRRELPGPQGPQTVQGPAAITGPWCPPLRQRWGRTTWRIPDQSADQTPNPHPATPQSGSKPTNRGPPEDQFEPRALNSSNVLGLGPSVSTDPNATTPNITPAIAPHPEPMDWKAPGQQQPGPTTARTSGPAPPGVLGENAHPKMSGANMERVKSPRRATVQPSSNTAPQCGDQPEKKATAYTLIKLTDADDQAHHQTNPEDWR